MRNQSAAVFYTAAFQLLWGLIWLVRLTEADAALFRFIVIGIAGGHFVAAFGLVRLFEWGRQRAVQLSGFDVMSALFGLLAGHLSPLGAVLQLGMPLYTLSVLNDPEVRQRFS